MNMFTADALILMFIWLTGIFTPMLGDFDILIPAIGVYAVVLRLLQLSVEDKKKIVMK